jgi:hypothetical protein
MNERKKVKEKEEKNGRKGREKIEQEMGENKGMASSDRLTSIRAPWQRKQNVDCRVMIFCKGV